MDFVSSMNNLMLTEKLIPSEWPQLGFLDPLPDLSADDGLRPFPESLDNYDPGCFAFSSLAPPPLVAYQCENTWLVEERPSLSAPAEEHIIDFDSLCWSDFNDLDLIIDPLSLCGTGSGEFVPAAAQDDTASLRDEIIGNVMSEEEEDKRGGGRDGKKPATPAVASRLSDLDFDEIKNYFNMPITKAAKEMNVGLTLLKKRCRELRIARWPHRKMKSLNSLINNVHELGKGLTEEDGLRMELERLEEHRRQMEENPEMQLTERTKKLRQACFKANYKKRRLSVMQRQQHQHLAD